MGVSAEHKKSLVSLQASSSNFAKNTARDLHVLCNGSVGIWTDNSAIERPDMLGRSHLAVGVTLAIVCDESPFDADFHRVVEILEREGELQFL